MSVAAASALAVAFGLAACRGTPPVEELADVYVPAPMEAGGESGDDAGPNAAPDAAFGLGQVDRAGHPLVGVLLVPGTHQDEYNELPSFADSVPRVLSDALESRLEFFDTLALGDAGPDPVDWPVPDGGAHPLLPLFLTDALLVDTSLACTQADGGYAASYLDIEREIYLQGPPHVTCGGRTPGDDVVATTLTLLVTGERPGAPPVAQGTAGPTKPATTTFPYLAPPN
jgi:hypothetical protein